MDLLGGTTNLLTSLLDAAPMLGGKKLAHFYVGVREVDAIANGQSTVLGSASTPYQLDLLQYQNGTSDWMTQTTVAQQTYSEIRYVVDLAYCEAVFSDGTTMPVSYSSAATQSSSGLGASTSTAADSAYEHTIDIVVHQPFSVSSTYSLAADFNLAESLSLGDGTLVMRPTMSTVNAPGQISGTVRSSGGLAVQGATVVAVGSNGAAVNSAATDAAGNFDIDALPAGVYVLEVYNAYTNAAGYERTASGQSSGAPSITGPTVTVNSGNTASAGTIGD